MRPTSSEVFSFGLNFSGGFTHVFLEVPTNLSAKKRGGPPGILTLLEAIQTPPDLEALFQDAAEDLARYFSRRHGGSGDASKDLVQETFLELARGLEKGKRPKSPRAYLFGIARKVSQAAWRRRYREREWTATDCSAEEVAAPAPDERIAAAEETITTLPPLQREVLDLRFSQQLSYAEIAVVLGIPVGTVRSRLHHAVRAVRERLESDDPDSPGN